MDIVGRDAELEIVGRFLDEASEARALLLTGEAGIGKSTIWQAALTDARARGYRVIGSRPTEAEARLPFAALTDLFGELVDELEPDLPEPQRRALDAALLRASGDGVAEPLAVSLAVLALLRAAIGSGPLLLAIDDIPWMDGSSAGVLEFALRRLEEEPIRLIAAERTVDASASTLPPVVRAMEHGRLERVIVRGLSVAELERLLGNVLEMDLPPSTLKRLHRTSGGNPFYAIEIARAMQRRGKAADQRDLPLPDSLSELIRDRIGALSPAAADVVLHAAALSQPTVGMIETAVGEDVASQGLAEAGEAGVLRVEAGVLRFAHPLLAAEAYAQAGVDRRRAVHRTVAELVAEPEERAKHMALAAEGPDAAVAAALEQAAERARQRGAPDAAAELTERAASLTPPDDEDAAMRRSLLAARYLLLAGDAGRARPMLEGLLQRAADGPTRAAVLSQLAEVRLHMDDWEAAESLYLEALPQARGDLRHQIDIKIALAGVGFITGRNWEAAARHISEAMGFAEELGDPEIEAAVIGHYATWQYMTGHGLRRDLMERAAELEPWTKQLRTMDHPDFDFALILVGRGRQGRVRASGWSACWSAPNTAATTRAFRFILTNLAGCGLRQTRTWRWHASGWIAPSVLARATGQWTAVRPHAHRQDPRCRQDGRRGGGTPAGRRGTSADRPDRLERWARTGHVRARRARVVARQPGRGQLSASTLPRRARSASGHHRRWTSDHVSGGSKRSSHSIGWMTRAGAARRIPTPRRSRWSASRPRRGCSRLRGLLLAVEWSCRGRVPPAHRRRRAAIRRSMTGRCCTIAAAVGRGPSAFSQARQSRRVAHPPPRGVHSLERSNLGRSRAARAESRDRQAGYGIGPDADAAQRGKAGG